MNKLALALLLVLAACGTHQSSPRKASHVIQEAIDNTVALQFPWGGTFCSGVIVDGLVLTAEHCTAVPVFVVEYFGTTHPVQVLRTWPEQDLALLATPLLLGKGLDLAKDAPDYGDTVYVLGHPLGKYEYSVTRGMVSHPRRVGAMSLSASMVWFQHDAAVVGGNSGGPVINRKGQLIGITSFGILQEVVCSFDCSGVYQDTDINGAVHLDSIRAFLARTPDGVNP